MRSPYFVPLLALLAACPTGGTARSFPTAKWPQGITADIRTFDRTLDPLTSRVTQADSRKVKGVRFRGELLAVRDSSLVVLRGGTLVTSVAMGAIRVGSFAKQGTLILDGVIEPRDRERLRLLSRFPAGLSPELEARLLAAYGQAAVDRIVQP